MQLLGKWGPWRHGQQGEEPAELIWSLSKELGVEMRSDHPDLLSKVSDDDIRSWVEIVA
jgi:hypothetical protein